MTPVLLVDQNGNEATVWLSESEVETLTHCSEENPCNPLVELPEDEGIDKLICYRINVRVVTA